MLFVRQELLLSKLSQKPRVNWYLEQFYCKIHVNICTFQSNKSIFKKKKSIPHLHMPCQCRPVRVSDINSYIIPFNCRQLLRSRSLSLTVVGVGEGNVEGISVSTMLQ